MSTVYIAKTGISLEGGLFVEATNRSGIYTILAANLKLRDERVAELAITLPGAAARVTPTYRVVDATHADAYDGSSSATLDLVSPPSVSGGIVTLMMQPRSVHLLQFDTTNSTLLQYGWPVRYFRG